MLRQAIHLLRGQFGKQYISTMECDLWWFLWEQVCLYRHREFEFEHVCCWEYPCIDNLTSVPHGGLSHLKTNKI